MSRSISVAVLLLAVQADAFASLNGARTLSSMRHVVHREFPRPSVTFRMKLTDEEVEERLAQLGKGRSGVPSGGQDEQAISGELSGVLQEIGLFVGALALFVIALAVSLS